MIEYWYMLPVATLFSSIAIAMGISAAALFTPFFLFVLGLPVPVAVGAALIIEMFGLTEGVWAFGKRKLISYPAAQSALIIALPLTVIGAILTLLLPERVILFLLAGFLLTLGFRILHQKHFALHKHAGAHPDCSHTHVRFNHQERVLLGVGGLFSGMSSVGAGEMSDYVLLKRFEGAAAAGTSVLVIALTALVGASVHAYAFFLHHTELSSLVFGVVVFAIPGALIGTRIGAWSTRFLNDSLRHMLLASLLFAIATITILLI